MELGTLARLISKQWASDITTIYLLSIIVSYEIVSFDCLD